VELATKGDEEMQNGTQPWWAPEPLPSKPSQANVSPVDPCFSSQFFITVSKYEQVEF
jgi:hypothetical protein